MLSDVFSSRLFMKVSAAAAAAASPKAHLLIHTAADESNTFLITSRVHPNKSAISRAL